MNHQDTAHWDLERWGQEYEELMEAAKSRFPQEWKGEEVVVIRTSTGKTHVVLIPDFQNHTLREPLENQLIQMLAQQNDTEIRSCLATVNGQTPEIPSWNFRSGLAALNPNNLHTRTFLWGGGNVIRIKPFSALLPPEKNGT